MMSVVMLLAAYMFILAQSWMMYYVAEILLGTISQEFCIQDWLWTKVDKNDPRSVARALWFPHVYSESMRAGDVTACDTQEFPVP